MDWSDISPALMQRAFWRVAFSVLRVAAVLAFSIWALAVGGAAIAAGIRDTPGHDLAFFASIAAWWNSIPLQTFMMAALALLALSILIVAGERVRQAEKKVAVLEASASKPKAWTSVERLESLQASLDTLLSGPSKEFAWDERFGQQEVEKFTGRIRAVLKHVLTEREHRQEAYMFDEALHRVNLFFTTADGKQYIAWRAMGARAHEWLLDFRARVNAGMMRQDAVPIGQLATENEEQES